MEPLTFDEKWLFVDPLESDESYKDKLGAVLLADEIRDYVLKYGLLIANRETFFEQNLKGASYSMKPDCCGGWEFDDKKELSELKIGRDNNGPYYCIRENSLVYIRLQQRLRLPFYIIGRHNLTIKYVYQGLLLGTGPQVDPGWVGKIHIPLHNLTNREIKLYLNKSFVSIDFVRTSKIKFENDTPSNVADFYTNYPGKKPINRVKIERKTVPDYLNGVAPRTSIGEWIPKFAKQSEEVREGIKENKKISRWSRAVDIIAIIAIFGLVIGILAYQSPVNRGQAADITKNTIGILRVNQQLLEMKKGQAFLKKYYNFLESQKKLSEETAKIRRTLTRMKNRITELEGKLRANKIVK